MPSGGSPLQSKRDFKPANLDLKQHSASSSIRTIPELIEYNAKVNPDALFCVQALKPQDEQTRRASQVTVRQLRNAVWQCSGDFRGWLVGIDDSSSSDEVQTHVKPDPVALLLVAHLLTTLKAQAVITSSRHAETVKAAFETTSNEYGRGGTKIQVARPFEDYLCEVWQGKALPADDTICAPRHYLSESDHNVIILHTSGTTGFPKPVHQPHKMLLGYACCHRATEAEDIEGLNFFKARSFTTVPYILEEISKLPDYKGIAQLTTLQYVACGGGPLSVAVGDQLVDKGIKLLNHFGSTETGLISPFMVPPKGYNWHYWPLRSDLDVSIEPHGSEEAKLVSERILAKAAEDWSSEMEVTYVRTGQLSGSERSGYWNAKEHFPALVKTSHEAGVFPRLHGTLSWLPVNVAAAAMSDLLFSPIPVSLTCHVENPVRKDWTAVMTAIANELGHPSSCSVEFEEWTRLVSEETSANHDSGTDVLMDFLLKEFQRMSAGGVVLDTARAREVSTTLRNADGVSAETIANSDDNAISSAHRATAPGTKEIGGSLGPRR
ncbi:hypothetical protein LA080_003070 [Diaporthe eres]|nr:hypothetical protein LA080_003070 [Diaporthe eres]